MVVTVVFDLVSFLAGVAAGALTAGLAGLLYSLESTAGIQEQMRVVTQRVDELATAFTGPSVVGLNDQDAKTKVDDLERMLDEIHEEIRRMYKRTSR
jgi:gas vesicle protein